MIAYIVDISTFFFYVLLAVHLGTIRVNNQLDELFKCVYFTSLHDASNPVLTSGEKIVSIHHLVYIILERSVCVKNLSYK